MRYKLFIFLFVGIFLLVSGIFLFWPNTDSELRSVGNVVKSDVKGDFLNISVYRLEGNGFFSPKKWVKRIDSVSGEDLVVDVPIDAKNIAVFDADGNWVQFSKTFVSGKISAEIELERDEGFFTRWWKNLRMVLTGNAVSEDYWEISVDSVCYDCRVRYETPTFLSNLFGN